MKQTRLIIACILLAAAFVLFAAGCGSAEISQTVHTEDPFGTANLNDPQKVVKEEPAPEPEPEPQIPTASGVIAIDAGHQARGDSSQEPVGPGASETKARVTSGTSGVSTGNEENAVNLEVALKLRDELVARGLTVVMVRETADVNISNSERAKVANDAHADLFIRLHCDGVDNSSTTGFMTLVPGENSFTGAIVEQSGAAADIMHPYIIDAIGARDRGIISRTDLSGFNWCEVPTVLFEMGCMSNPEEDEKLGSGEYQQLLATSIADATVEYMKSRS